MQISETKESKGEFKVDFEEHICSRLFLFLRSF
jgi:hypothetical protein